MCEKIPQHHTVADRGAGIPAEAAAHYRLYSEEKGVANSQRQQRDPEREAWNRVLDFTTRRKSSQGTFHYQQTGGKRVGSWYGNTWVKGKGRRRRAATTGREGGGREREQELGGRKRKPVCVAVAEWISRKEKRQEVGEPFKKTEDSRVSLHDANLRFIPIATWEWPDLFYIFLWLLYGDWTERQKWGWQDEVHEAWDNLDRVWQYRWEG